MIAALFVEKGGVYDNLPGVDAWTVERDARLYAGTWPVVAHPPCARWGRMAEVAFGRRHGGKLGDDDGCFAAALHAVRTWGGVLEHPASSRAWETYGLLAPPTSGGWVCDGYGERRGWTCHVEQGHYGHRTRKATWLYASGIGALPSLTWGPSSPAGFTHNSSKGETFTAMGKRARSRTPIPFRDLLISIAESARGVTAPAEAKSEPREPTPAEWSPK